MESVNFHASLLPLLRGASPIEHSLIQRFKETGWTLQRLAETLDTGGILWQLPIPISSQDDTPTLSHRLIESLLKEGTNALFQYATRNLTEKPQDDTIATHCGKISATMGQIQLLLGDLQA